jgi:hypothetical protein
MKYSTIIGNCAVLALGILILHSGCRSGFGGDQQLPGLPDVVDFNFHIKPILSDRCFKCHGPDRNTLEADLRLDQEESALQKMLENGGHAFVPGKPHKSVAYQRITSQDPELQMPPPDSRLALSEYEIALIGKWIDQGAQYRKHWSFIPPVKPPLPEVHNPAWVKNDLDRFVLAALEKAGKQPNTSADKETLLRRLYLDITGLPPTPREMDEFLQNDDQAAVESVVDRLLQSPHYGERMALDWMDVARYADSHGYSQDGSRIMYPWRDWVIKAFNDNMPFDQFITWQMAGDLLPEPTREQKLATAFLRNHRINAEGGIIPEEYRVEYVADRSHTTATAFLGLTMECARCHDHKYDPISQKEYFQFFDFFNQTNEEGQGSPDGNTGPEIYLPDDAVAERVAYFDQKIREQEDRLAQRKTEVLPALMADLPGKKPDLSSIRAGLHQDLMAHLNFDAGFSEQKASGGTQKRVKDDKLARDYPVRGSAELVSSIRGQALKAGAYDGMSLPASLINFRRSDPFSFSFWLQAHPETGFMEILHRMGTKYSRQNGYDIAIRNGQLAFRLAHSLPANLIEVRMDEILSPDQWAHIAITYDGSGRADGVQFYRNGQPAQSTIVFDQLERNVTHEGSLTVGGTIHLEENIDDGYFLIDELHIYGKALTGPEVALTFNDAESQISDHQLASHYLHRQDKRWLSIQDSLRHYREMRNELENQFLGVMVMRDLPQPRPTYILNRGQYDAPGERVSAGTPASLLPFPENLPTNRLGLARWLTDLENPLTARVIVNRVWAQFFGRGIVTTVEDFGSQGDLPSHPELLDWLATTFVESGWNVKALIKTIVLSSTYQQSSIVPLKERQKDPDNRLLARGPSFRLPAEILRDQVLEAAGLLTDQIGGPSVKPYQPDGLWEEKTRFTRDLATYVQDHGPDLYRRSLYTFWRRTSHHPVMSVFDAPTRDNCTVRRQMSNTPLQALALLNETQFVEAARALAGRVMQEESTLMGQITLAYRLVTGCRPPDELVARLADLWLEERRHYEINPEKAGELLAIGEYRIPTELNTIDQAALTIVCNTLMNFDEVLSRR